MTTIVLRLNDAREIALLEVIRPCVDWRAVRTVAAGRRSPLAGLEAAPVWERVLLAEVARMAGVTRAAVVNWRRRHDDFPAALAGTEGVHPLFDRRQVAAWLLAHGKIEIPTGPAVASLVLAGPGRAMHRFRLDDPWLTLADDPAGEDQLSGWATEDDADALAELAADASGAAVHRLTALGTTALAVPGRVRVIDRFRAGAGGLLVTLAWPAGLRGAASARPAGGVVRHGVPYAAPGEGCGCRRFDCGGLDPVTWCPDHGTAAAPVMEWHPGGGLRCTALSRRRASVAAHG
ncbi:hypothetical protein ACIRBY_38255 [Streptomyces sp. NPDC096136]|uniref:hypothetical protein n=1 Tax=Streptomyces sp. NPDC096136 TaxID=3366076 RepID=UPI00382507C9